MLTVKERQKLKSLLAHAVQPDEALSIDQLEGYLFGIVITPDVTQPSEWFTDIFGESLASFEDEQLANAKFADLMDAYNRLNALRLNGRLQFPFDLANPDQQALEKARNWAVGLDKALALRSYIWLPEEVLEQEDISEEDEEIMTCLMIVLGVAHPEQIPEIFTDTTEQGMDATSLWNDLLGHLPVAVKTLQVHAQLLEEERLAGESMTNPTSAAPKIGRNDPCPCGSGRKYKKCCGLN